MILTKGVCRPWENRTLTAPPEETLRDLEASRTGLTSAQAAERLERFGKNALAEGKKKSGLQVFLEQFQDLLVVILLVAAVISAVSGNVESTIVIFAVLILNAILGTVQHFKAEKSLESLKAMSSPTAKVLRDGERAVSALRPDRPRGHRGAGGRRHGGGRRPHSGELLPEGQ